MEDITLDDQVDTLAAMFPNINRKTVRSTLLANHGNIEIAVSILLTAPETKESLRDLTAFELHQILVKIDQDQAHTFYSHGLTGAMFVTLSSDEAQKYGIHLGPFQLATLKQHVKDIFKKGADDDDFDRYLENFSSDFKEEDESSDVGPQKYVYVTSLPTLVREKKALTSTPVGGIGPGTKLQVKKVDGNRIKISHPLKGWLSIVAKNGVRIIVKMRETDHDAIVAKELENPETYNVTYDSMYPEDYDYDQNDLVEGDSESNQEQGFWSRMMSNMSFKKNTKFDFAESDHEEEPSSVNQDYELDSYAAEIVMGQENYL